MESINRSVLFYICLVFALLIQGGLCDSLKYGYLGARECKNFGLSYGFNKVSVLATTSMESGMYVCNVSDSPVSFGYYVIE